MLKRARPGLGVRVIGLFDGAQKRDCLRQPVAGGAVISIKRLGGGDPPYPDRRADIARGAKDRVSVIHILAMVRCSGQEPLACDECKRLAGHASARAGILLGPRQQPQGGALLLGER